MCLYAISHAAAARQRYSILQHQLRSARNARTSGHAAVCTGAELLAQADGGRAARGEEEEDSKRTRRPAQHDTASSSRGGLEGNAPSPARQGALVLGKDFVKSNSAKQPCDRHQGQQGSRW